MKEEMFYLTTHSTHFIYSYVASDIWLWTTQIVREETRCHHMGYSFRLAVRVLLYASSHRQDNTYHSFCYTSHGALAGTRNSSMGPPHEGSIRRPIAPRANAFTTELHLVPHSWFEMMLCNTSTKTSGFFVFVISKLYFVDCVSFVSDFFHRKGYHFVQFQFLRTFNLTSSHHILINLKSKYTIHTQRSPIAFSNSCKSFGRACTKESNRMSTCCFSTAK